MVSDVTLVRPALQSWIKARQLLTTLLFAMLTLEDLVSQFAASDSRIRTVIFCEVVTFYPYREVATEGGMSGQDQGSPFGGGMSDEQPWLLPNICVQVPPGAAVN